MHHTIEPAASGRAKCRGCKLPIAKGELRFGERLPNPFADGEMTIWFHLECAALRRPASFMETIESDPGPLPDDDLTKLREIATVGTAHHRLERICGAERAPSGRARCRACGEAIKKQTWRIALEFFEEGMFNPAGYVHPACASTYFGTPDIEGRIAQFGNLAAADVADLMQEIS